MAGELGSASGSIILEVARARQNVAALSGDLRSFSSSVGSSFQGASQFIDQHEQSIKTVGQGLLGLGAVATGVFAAGVWNAANVEEAFAIMQAGTGASGAELEKLQTLALKLGKDTKFSASEAAAAITELGKAGMPVETILNGAADAVVNLAVAGEMDLASAANVLTASMNQFGLSADQAVNVVDTLARGAAISTADIGDLASGLTYVGTTANQLGFSLEDTTAALSALNDQGLRGTMAGTALNQMLTSLINPSAKARKSMDELGLSIGETNAIINDDGTMKTLPEIIANVDNATRDLTETERARYLNQIFGEQGGRAINALLQTQTDEAKAAGKGWEDYADGVREGQSASDVAAAKMDNLKGDIEQFRGGLETLAYTAMTGLLPAFRGVVQFADGFVGMLIALPGPIQTVLAVLTGLVGVLGLAGGSFLLMLPRINETVKAIRVLRTALPGLQAGLKGAAMAMRAFAMANPILLAVMAAVALALIAYKFNLFGFRDAVDGVIDRIGRFISVFRDSFNFLKNTGKYDGVTAAFRALGFAIADLTGLDLMMVVSFFTGLGKAISRPIAALKKMATGLGGIASALLKGDFKGALKQFQKFAAGIGDFLGSPAKAIGSFLKGIKTGFGPLDAVLNNAGKLWTDFGRIIQELFQGDLSGALAVGRRMLGHFADYFSSIGTLLITGAKAIGRALLDAFRGIDWGAVADSVGEGIRSALLAILEAGSWMAGQAGRLWDWIKDSIGGIDWGAIRDGILSALQAALSGLSVALDWLLDTGIPALSGWIKDVAGDIWGGLKSLAGWASDAVSGTIDLALSVLDKLSETVLSGFSSAKGWLIDKLPWLEGPLNSAGEAFSALFDLTMNIAGKLASTLGAAWQSVRSLISSVAGWLADFFGIGDDGTSSGAKTTTATGNTSLVFNLLGSFLNFLSAAWSSVKSLIATAAGWIAGFFGIGDDGSATTTTKTGTASMSLAFFIFGAIRNFLSGAWSSLTGLIGSVGSWLAGFFGIGGTDDFGKTVSKTASAALTMAAEFGEQITDNLGTKWKSVKSLVGSVSTVASDLVDSSWGGAKKLVSSTVEIAVEVTGSIKDSLGAGWEFLFGKDGDGGGQAVSLQTRLTEIVTAITTGLTDISNAFSNFDVGAQIRGLNDKIVSGLGAMDGSAIGAAAKAWVERGLAKMGDGITTESVMGIPRAIDTAAGGAFGSMSGDSLSSGMKGWITRAVALVATGLEGQGLAFARAIDTSAGTGFSALSGESLSAGMRGWITRAVTVTATLLDGIGLGLARSIDTAAGTGFGALSGASLSSGIVSWVGRAQTLAASSVNMSALADGVGTKLQSALGPKLTQIVTSFQSFATSVVSEMNRLATGVTQQADRMANNMRTAGNRARQEMTTSFNQIVSAVRTAAANISTEAARAGDRLVTALSNGGRRAVTAMQSAMNEIIGIVQSAAGRMYSAGLAVGAAAGDGVAAGLEGALGRVRSAAQQIISTVDAAMRKKAEISSPSKVTRYIGEMLGAGPVVGMLSTLDDVRRAASQLAAAAIPMIDRSLIDTGLGSYLAQQLDAQRQVNQMAGLSLAPQASIGTQNITLNVTQLPGEDGEALARRTIALLSDAYDGVNGLGV